MEDDFIHHSHLWRLSVGVLVFPGLPFLRLLFEYLTSAVQEYARDHCYFKSLCTN